MDAAFEALLYIIFAPLPYVLAIFGCVYGITLLTRLLRGAGKSIL